MEGEALVAIQPGSNLRVLVGGVVVEDHMHGLARWRLGFDGVEEADEFLMPMALHVAPDDGAIQHVQSGKERRGAVAFVVVRHGPEPPLLQRQTGLGAVERLDLALLVNREHDGMSGWIDVEPDHVSELLGEPGVVGELELAIAVRLQTMRSPDAPDGAGTDASLLGHHGGGPVGCLDQWVGQREGDHPLGDVRPERLDPGGARLVAQQAVDALVHEALLPAPHASFGDAGPTHDLSGADAIGAQQHDSRPPDVLLGRVPVAGQRLKAMPV